MPRAAVLGSPVAHSLSPALHRAAYAALRLPDWSYDAVECDEAGLPGFLAGLGPDWVGLSLTMPLKRAVLSHVDTVSELAAAVGAANTVLLSGRRRHADNTDVGGMVDALAGTGPGIDVGAPVVLGAGGTAAAAVAALRELGAAGVTVVARDAGRAGDLVAAAERLAVPVRLARWPVVPRSATLVVSTVPAAAAAELAVDSWRPETTVFDVLYQPWPTPLATAAAAAGCRVVTGLELLLHQAGRQVTLMTGRPAPLGAMRTVLPTG